MASTTMRIFLTGVGCVGKTTIGRILAPLLNIGFYDLDEEIEKYFKTSLERLQNKFITIHSFQAEASRALGHILCKKEARRCVIAMPPSGLKWAYSRIIKKENGISVVIEDTPENILKRITFYDIDSRQIFKTLTKREEKIYLAQIKDDISYFRPSYQKADYRININGLPPNEAALKIRLTLFPTEGPPAHEPQSASLKKDKK